MNPISFPWPPKELTPNFKRSHHWSAYRPQTKKYRADCWALTKEARWRVAAGDVPVLLSVTFYPPDLRRRDRDGMEGAFKAGFDGIADALGIDDNWFRPEYHFADSIKHGAVVVELIDCEARPIGEIIKPILAGIALRMDDAA